MKRFIVKNKYQSKPLAYKVDKNIIQAQTIVENDIVVTDEWKVEEDVLFIGSGEKENNEKKNINDMDTQEKIMMANAILNKQDDLTNKVKKVRKDRGLIEKTESSKIILTEDNRELLND